MVSNSSAFGSNADTSRSDVTVIGAVPRGRLIHLLPIVYSGSNLACTEARAFRVRCIRLSTRDVTTCADDEPFAPLPLTAECVPRAALALAQPR